MTPEVAVAERLSDVNAVTAIVSTRIYSERLPQKPTYPAVLVRLVDEPRDAHLRGGIRDKARVQVDAYVAEGNGTDAKQTCDELADAIHGDDAGSGLSGWAGSIGSPAFQVQGIIPIARGSDYESDELHLYRVWQDYQVLFGQAAMT